MGPMSETSAVSGNASAAMLQALAGVLRETLDSEAQAVEELLESAAAVTESVLDLQA